MMRLRPATVISILGLAMVAAAIKQGLGYQDTPILPGTKWHVHDGNRPQPRVVTPGYYGSAPSDAKILFGGTDLSAWRGDGANGPVNWIVKDGAAQVNGGAITTKEFFGDCQLHVEFASPYPGRGAGQGRGNSGIFLMERYEIQVLDNFGNQTYPDGQATAIYGQTPPLVNASRRPGDWQTYDIFWMAPVFEGEKLVSPAYVTVVHNGVLVQNHTEVRGPTTHRGITPYSAHPARLPISIQDHGDPVRFRNIWIRDLPASDRS